MTAQGVASQTGSGPEPPNTPLNQGRPHSARMYDYFLGGKDNYVADREAAAKVLTLWPGVMIAARTNRAWMHRAIRFLAAERGIRQFLDIGTGIPTRPNLHEVAQGIAPESRVVYVDNDPIVLAHAQALLKSRPEGRTAYVHGDVTEPEAILASPDLTEVLDLSQPVALSLVSLLHFVPDEWGPYDLVQRLVDALAPGSFLVLSHITPDFDPEATQKTVQVYHSGGIQGKIRTRDEVERFFTGLELVEPGLEVPHRWRADLAETDSHVETGDVTDEEVSFWAGVAQKS
ncbi:SAM-dependent methyltransferase [Streptomyces sp. DSM 41524]|uniref:SAM-dependent methyltransferase n=1 Tax=Streptomyces asiaticus subsp. ignotus TaxID=3098222 RepID=A0ABU7PR33_9ACTN|nr:SAM-dependent methyltransferase [Streptomyces sp. DASNCL29]MEE4591546.1 SAM-dependent methyltransferase [Streptomyces sp. DSM 41524]TMU99532.1 SAM-dependent methyltransferase [Streptomyces sp. DASNCL29]